MLDLKKVKKSEIIGIVGKHVFFRIFLSCQIGFIPFFGNFSERIFSISRTQILVHMSTAKKIHLETSDFVTILRPIISNMNMDTESKYNKQFWYYWFLVIFPAIHFESFFYFEVTLDNWNSRTLEIVILLSCRWILIANGNNSSSWLSKIQHIPILDNFLHLLSVIFISKDIMQKLIKY